jgi:FlgD Ig-like domain
MSSDSLRRARILSALVVVGLLGGTAAAFAWTEHLKLERSPVYRTHVGKLLGPNCRCGLAQIPIRFVLRKPETLTVTIVDSNERVVRTLLSRTPRPKGVQRFGWDGRDDSGRVVPHGTYKPRLHLARDHRTILMPNPIHVDTAPPQVAVVSVRPRAFSPDGDGRSDLVRIRVRTTEPARALLFVNGRLRVRLRRYGNVGVLRWFGAGYPPGRYRLVVRAVDRFGNLSAPSRAGVVRVRFVSVRPHVLHAKAGAKVRFRIRTDARRVHWRLGNAGGFSRPGLLVLRAPPAGRYVLRVTANAYTATSVLIVSGP